MRVFMPLIVALPVFAKLTGYGGKSLLLRQILSLLLYSTHDISVLHSHATTNNIRRNQVIGRG